MGEVGTIWIRIGAKIDAFEKGMSDAEKALKKVGERFQDIGKKVSIAGAAIVGSMGLTIIKTAKFGDELDEMSERTGVSVSILSSLKLAADKSGTSLGGLANGLKFLSINMMETAKAAVKSKTELGALGINVKDAAGNMRPLNDVMLDVAERFKTMPDGAQKTALAVKLFGRSGMDMIPILNLGKQGLQAQMEMAHKLGIVLTDEAAKACAKFADEQVNLKAAVQGLGMQISMQLIPALTSVISFVANVIAKVKDWAKENPAISDGIKMVSGSLLALGGLLVVGGPILIGIGTLLKYLRELKLIAKAPIAIVITIAIPAIMQIIKDFKTNMKQWQDAAATGGQKTSIFVRVLESANMVWEKWIVGLNRGKIAMNAMAAMSDKFKGSMQVALGVAGEAGAKLDLATKATKSWNEELGITTRLELEKKIALMEQALVKYRQQMPISEQARLTEEIKEAKDELSGFNITAQVTLGLLPSLREKTANLVATFDSWLSLLPNLRKETVDLFITWEDGASKMEFVNEEISTSWDNTVNEIRGVWQAGLLEMLRGTKTFGDLIQNMFSTIGSAVSESIFKAFTKAGSKLAESLGAFAGPIGAALGAVAGSLISLIGGLFEKKPKKTEAERMAEEITQMAKEEIATLAVYGKVSEDTAKKIAEARQSGMAGYAAISKYFADIIRDTGVTGENINKLWAGVGEIIDRIKSGALSAADGIKSLGDSFTAMLEGAKKLGQEGGQAMVDFILKLRNSGIEVAEVTQYVLEQLGKIPSALATLVSNIYMPTTPIKALQKELDKLTEKLKGVKEGTDEWKTITTRIGEINKEIGITNKHIPQTAKELGAMGQIATASFQAMLANGMNFLDALNAMKEPLQGLLARYKALGIAIPAFLKPLLRMEWLAEKFPVAFQNMGAALDVLNSLRNAAYLTQGTFDALASSIATSAKSILGITGSLNSFMKVAHLSQTEIQLLLPIVSQFVGAAAIFGLGIPAWMKTFVTKQLGVDWEKFKEAAKLQANAGIATVEELKKRMIQAKNLQAELKVADWKLMRDLRESLREKLDRVIDAIKGVPGAQSGCYFTKPALVHVAEHGPEAILNRQQLSNLIGGGAGRNLNLTFNINAIDNEGMKTVVHKKVIPMIIDAINNNTGHLGTRLKTAQGIA